MSSLKDIVEKSGQAVTGAIHAAADAVENAADRVQKGQPIVPKENVDLAKGFVSSAITTAVDAVKGALGDLKEGALESTPDVAFSIIRLNAAAANFAGSVVDKSKEKLSDIADEVEVKVGRILNSYPLGMMCRQNCLQEIDDYVDQFKAASAKLEKARNDVTKERYALDRKEAAFRLQMHLNLLEFLSVRLDMMDEEIPSVGELLGITNEEFFALLTT